MTIEYTNFVLRQFDPKAAGTKLDMSIKDSLLEEANFYYDKTQQYIQLSTTKMPRYRFMDSYQDFCKYLIIENPIPSIKAGVTELTLDKYPFIRTGYSSRTPNELPVLSRWVELPSGFSKPTAKYLVFVLYTREQLLKEHSATDYSVNEFELSDDCKYGIVAVLGTLEPKPDPMPPITVMRNALGIEEGGNGAKLDHNLYEESVEFWEKYIMLK